MRKWTLRLFILSAAMDGPCGFGLCLERNSAQTEVRATNNS